jgi:5-methylcytosine-specific restriction endonuclease McrA
MTDLQAGRIFLYPGGASVGLRKDMPTYRTTKESEFYAPFGTCRKCGWIGKDWGFKYHGYCKKCHSQWRKEKAEERRGLKGPNVNIELADGITVTRNVRQRLERQAHRDVPRIKGELLWPVGRALGALTSLAIGLPLLGGILALSDAHARDLKLLLFLVMCEIGGCVAFSICDRKQGNEARRRQSKVDVRVDTLARERQRRIDETNTFYTSSEWRLIREQVIQEEGRVCQRCRRYISNDNDLTVDHIKPRSKFPELALEKSNLQILCRKCNSAKGATCDESNGVLDGGGSVIESTSRV